MKNFLAVFFFLSVAVAQISPPLNTKGKQILLMDANTDTVLFSKDADELMDPGSMTKIMTAYLVFKQIKEGKLSFDTVFSVSKDAVGRVSKVTNGTLMYLSPGKFVSVRELIQGLFVASGNDACVCLAENIAGSEENFVELMNATAKKFGATQTNFTNSHGGPEDSQKSTCRDLYVMAKSMYLHFPEPEFQEFFKQKTFKYAGAKGVFNSPNDLLRNLSSADGLKTGHTEAGGYGVVGSANDNGRHHILVINGCVSRIDRSKSSVLLMKWGFDNFRQLTLFAKGDTVGYADTWLAQEERLPLEVQKDFIVTVPKFFLGKISAELVYNGPIEAPVQQGKPVGELAVNLGDGVLVSQKLFAQKSLEKANFFSRLPTVINYLLFGHNVNEE